MKLNQGKWWHLFPVYFDVIHAGWSTVLYHVELCLACSSIFLTIVILLSHLYWSVLKDFLVLDQYDPVLLLSTAYYLPQNAGHIARKYIKDPQLLSFIDAEVWQSHSHEHIKHSSNFIVFRIYIRPIHNLRGNFPCGFLQCFIVSTVNALQTPMINASMVSISSIFKLFCAYWYFVFSHIFAPGSLWQAFWRD